MRTIKKTVTVTTANVYRMNLDTMMVEEVGHKTWLGGRGERLAVSECKREFGGDCVVKVENDKRVYVMDADTFFEHASVCDDASEDDCDEL